MTDSNIVALVLKLFCYKLISVTKIKFFKTLLSSSKLNFYQNLFQAHNLHNFDNPRLRTGYSQNDYIKIKVCKSRDNFILCM